MSVTFAPGYVQRSAGINFPLENNMLEGFPTFPGGWNLGF
jgi:hypothetical protein